MALCSARCGRCGGLVVYAGDVRHVGWRDVTFWEAEPVSGPIWECVNCGAYADRVIVENQAQQRCAVASMARGRART